MGRRGERDGCINVDLLKPGLIFEKHETDLERGETVSIILRGGELLESGRTTTWSHSLRQGTVESTKRASDARD